MPVGQNMMSGKKMIGAHQSHSETTADGIQLRLRLIALREARLAEKCDGGVVAH